MSADKKGPFGKSKLSEILDFGPDSHVDAHVVSPSLPSNESKSFTERLKQIVKKLQEMNERIENLSNRF